VRRGRRALLLLFAAALGARAVAEVPLPEGYRTEDYRAPTPDRVPGARTLDTAQAEAVWRQGGAVWIDVLPAPRRPAELPATALWLPSPRRGIPGSLWLPEVGRGVLAPVLEAWFRGELRRATGGDLDRPVVFYCQAECWMSWNAAKRAAAWGWRAVHWYPEGTDGWEAAGLPTEALHPPPDAP
jgi:PQQ-dependent catabolism-associated CXXCW motif protein